MSRKKVKEMIFAWIKQHCSYIDYLKITEKYRQLTSFAGKSELDKSYIYSKAKKTPVYYVLRMTYPMMGLMAVARLYLFAAIWAEKQGFIPLVDFEYDSDFLSGRLNCNNLWTEVFEQPVTIDDAIKNGTVIAGTVNTVDGYDEATFAQINGSCEDKMIMACDGASGKEYYAKWNAWAQKYWRIRANITEEFEQNYGWLFSGNYRILGVMMREHFSKESREKIKNEEHMKILEIHPLLPSVEESLEYVKEYFEKWKCDYIFLGTIEEQTVKEFQKVFGEKVVYIQRRRNAINDSKEDVQKDVFEMNGEEIKEMFPFEQANECHRKYIMEIYGLSKCTFFAGAICSGTLAALVMNGGKYQDTFLFPDYNPNSRYMKK